MQERVSRSTQPMAPRVSRIITFASLIVLVGLVSPSQAVDYRSGWYIAEGTPDQGQDLLTAESLDGEIWAFGSDAIILRSVDGGRTWEQQLDIEGENIFTEDIHHSDSGFGAIVVAGDSGLVLLKQESGADWTDISLPTGTQVNGVSLTDNQSVVAVGAGGSIWNYNGNGWEYITAGVDADLMAVSFFEERGVVVGASGTILFSEDSGASWDYRDSPSESSDSTIVSVDFFSDVRIYAVTNEGEVLKSSRVGTTDVGLLWERVAIERHYPPGSTEFDGPLTSVGVEVNSIEVVSTNKFLLTGPDGYISMSNDGGNIFRQQINPLGNQSNCRDFAMLGNFDGVAVCYGGDILWTDRAGEDEQVGFEVVDFTHFGNFVDYSKEMLIDGLKATVKIVMFGIVLGFLLGVNLAMMKTAPTTLKDIAQKLDRYYLLSLILIPLLVIGAPLRERNPVSPIFASLRNLSASSTRPLNVWALRVFGIAMLGLGIKLILDILSIVRGLGLGGGPGLDIDDWEFIYLPIGLISPEGINGEIYFGNFFSLLFGIALILLGLLFMTVRGGFPKREVRLPFRGIIIKWNPWGTRPLNSIATVYTDIFRNTPLLVQFLFIHFGVQLGRLVGDPGVVLLEDSTNFFLVFLRDGILDDRTCVSSIFALGLNSGAYQCETIRGAISAIPSGQMEAGRSIGLNYMQTMGLVIMPQAIRICIPPMGNEMVNLVLNSSLAMIIGYSELTRKAKLINAVTFQLFWGWGMVLVSYFVVTWTLALFLRHMEKKTRIPGLGIGGGE